MKIVELSYINYETWKLHIVVDDDATQEEIEAAANLAVEDGNFFENATSDNNNTTVLVQAKDVLDAGGDYLYTVDSDGNVWDYDEES